MASGKDIKAGRAYVELGVGDKMLAGLRKAQARLRAFGASVGRMGRKLTGLASAMALPMGAGLKVYADFERQMAQVSTMLDRPEDHMKRFTDGVRRMSVEFGESTEALAGGLYDILSASVAPGKALDVLAVAARAAKAGLTDTKTAADAITTILNSYGLAAEDAGKVSDWMFTVVKNGKTTFAELAPSIGMVTSTASSAGVSLDELGAILATMTRNGVKTDNAITAVQATIMSFLKPTSEASEAAARLGFNLDSATLRAEGLQGVFARIAKLPPDAIAKLFPNVRALRGVIPAIKNMKGFAGDLEAMAGKAGATEAAYGKMAGTLSTSFARLKQAGLGLLSAIGEQLAPTFNRLAGTIRGSVGQVTEWVRANKEAIIQTVKIVAGVAAVGTGLIAMGAAIGAVSTILGTLITVVKLAALALMSLGKAAIFLARNPMVLLAAVVAAAIAQNIDWSKALGKLKKSVMDLLPSFSKFGQVSYKTTEQLKAEQAAMEGKARRLAELRNKHRLTNAEMVEAEELSHALTTAYPKLAGAIDDLGKSADGTRRAIEAMQNAFAENLIREKEKEIEAGKAWIERLKAQAEAAKAAGRKAQELRASENSIPVYGDPVTSTTNALGSLTGWWDTRFGREGRVKELREQAAAQQAIADEYGEIANKIAYGTKNIAIMEAHVAKLKAAMAKPPKEVVAAPTVDLAEEAAKFNKAYLETVNPLWAKLKADWRSRNAEMAALMLDLEAIRAEGIGNALDRELELTRISYQRRIDAAREANKSIILIEAAREAELAQIRKRHADEAAQARRDHEQSIAEEIGRLKIETTQEGLAKTLALLRLQERQEIEAARKVGANVELVREKYRLRQALAEKSAAAQEGKAKAQEVEPGGSVVGTFSGYALGLFGSALKMDRLVTATEATARNTKDINRKKGLAFG